MEGEVKSNFLFLVYTVPVNLKIHSLSFIININNIIKDFIMFDKKEPKYLYKPSKEDLKKALDSMEEIQKIIKKKKIPYIPSEKMADLLKE